MQSVDRHLGDASVSLMCLAADRRQGAGIENIHAPHGGPVGIDEPLRPDECLAAADLSHPRLIGPDARLVDPTPAALGDDPRIVVRREPGGLNVKGCILMFCQAQHWKPAKGG